MFAFLPSFPNFNLLDRHICLIKIGINQVADDFSVFEFELFLKIGHLWTICHKYHIHKFLIIRDFLDFKYSDSSHEK